MSGRRYCPRAASQTCRPRGLARAGAACLFLFLGLSACQFAPPLRVPAVPTAPRYTAAPAPRRTDTGPGHRVALQEFTYGATLSRPWWKLFRSPHLDSAVALALRHSPTVAAAEAQLRAARANVQVSAAVFYPQVGLDLGASRTKSSGANFGGHLPGSTFSLYTGNVAVSYYPDFFGINRLVYRGSAAQMNAEHAALAAARLTLAGNVVDAAIGTATASAQIKAIIAVIGAQRRLLRLIESQYRGGGVTYAGVLAQRAQLAASESQLPPLQQELSAYRHLFAVLLGESPSQTRDDTFTLRAFTLPNDIPVALPSALLRHRPDIRIAEEQMRYALTGVGIAKAQFYPLVTLTASTGASALTAEKLFDASSTIWSLGGALAQPIFEGGKLRAQERAAYATYDATRATYRSTVLGAFQQVADALRALEHDGAAERDQERLTRALRVQIGLAEAGYRSGETDFSTVLLAKIDYQNALISSASITAARLQDSTALFVALGGDWWPHHPSAAARAGAVRP